MLKDKETTYQIPEKDSISVEPNFEAGKVWQFIDDNIAGFPSYYQLIKDSDKENRISEFLIRHFTLCIAEQNCYFPYYFGKNPTQSQSDRETDIGVFVLIRSVSPLPIIEFEAKRLSNTSNNKEYVCGERGGIERFKRGQHSSHLSKCGMFGYIQNDVSANWINKINRWIDELADTNENKSIIWSKEETLVRNSSIPNIEKCSSRHQRLHKNDTIFLWHYFIHL